MPAPLLVTLVTLPEVLLTIAPAISALPVPIKFRILVLAVPVAVKSLVNFRSPLAFEASRLAWLLLFVEARLMTLSVVSPVPVYLRMFVPLDDVPKLMVLFVPR